MQIAIINYITGSTSTQKEGEPHNPTETTRDQGKRVEERQRPPHGQRRQIEGRRSQAERGVSNTEERTGFAYRRSGIDETL